ncbi:MAG TPA: serine/threonine protein kinase, partial [Cyanothece sp. UBA12306]|nr:serine/threonine protein kinase [Cyanothece sp. UBA12306]
APVASSSKKSFSSLELISSAGLTGFEGTLLIIILKSLIPSPGIIVAIACILIGGMIYGQNRRILEGKDLPILITITLLLMLFPFLRGGLAISVVAILAILSGAAAIAITALFRLIYRFLSRLL